MVWNKEEGLLVAGHSAPGWQEEGNMPGNSHELLEEAFDTLIYLDEKLLNLEYSSDNEELIRRVFGSLVRLYGLFWALRSRREFRMVAQAKALWSYIHHGGAPVEREQLHYMFGLTRSLEGHLIKLSERVETGLALHKQNKSTYPSRRTQGSSHQTSGVERQSLDERRRERDEQWSVGIQQHLTMIEMLAVERIILERDSGEHFAPEHFLGAFSGAKTPSMPLPTDMSSLYTTLRELGQQMQELREHLGTQMSSVVKQSLTSMGSLYRFLRKGLRTLYSQSDEKVGLHGLIFSSREQCLLLPTSSWMDIISCEEANFSQVGNQLFLCWNEQHKQQLPVRSLDDLSEQWTPNLSSDDLPSVGPSWLLDTMELSVPVGDHPFSEMERFEEHNKRAPLQGYCVVVHGANGPYALHVTSIIGEMMIALLETPDNEGDDHSPIKAVGLLPDARIVRVLDTSKLDQSIGFALPFETC